MKLILALLFLPLLHCKSFFSGSPSSLPSGCSSLTVGSCDPSIDELVDTYPLPNSVTAEETCQTVCEIQEGCNYFTYNRKEELCSLFHYRYLDSCQLLGAPASPSIDECHQQVEDSCDSFVRENCRYTGEVVLKRTSITDAHSCQQLLLTIGFVFQAEYFVYDSTQHSCVFYDSPQANCDALSGPVLPKIQDCRGQVTSTTTRAPTEISTSITTTNAPTRVPTDAPTKVPTNAPTKAPTDAPTKAPTDAPTNAPTNAPTKAPTESPTNAPTDAPTNSPTDAPTNAPTDAPINSPTDAPTDAPTLTPTKAPTNAPTKAPTDAPTKTPTGRLLEKSCPGGSLGECIRRCPSSPAAYKACVKECQRHC